MRLVDTDVRLTILKWKEEDFAPAIHQLNQR